MAAQKRAPAPSGAKLLRLTRYRSTPPTWPSPRHRKSTRNGKKSRGYEVSVTGFVVGWWSTGTAVILSLWWHHGGAEPNISLRHRVVIWILSNTVIYDALPSSTPPSCVPCFLILISKRYHNNMIIYGGYSLKRDAALKPFLKKSLHAERPRTATDRDRWTDRWTDQ